MKFIPFAEGYGLEPYRGGTNQEKPTMLTMNSRTLDRLAESRRLHGYRQGPRDRIRHPVAGGIVLAP